mmetsp:Transcript_25970/g.29714  ORF Transcript_25970/g.29714 Transcript_25970/m.29714 type:complete len:98 (+) Transcript_25970:94-387(+)
MREMNNFWYMLPSTKLRQFNSNDSKNFYISVVTRDLNEGMHGFFFIIFSPPNSPSFFLHHLSNSKHDRVMKELINVEEWKNAFPPAFVLKCRGVQKP